MERDFVLSRCDCGYGCVLCVVCVCVGGVVVWFHFELTLSHSRFLLLWDVLVVAVACDISSRPCAHWTCTRVTPHILSCNRMYPHPPPLPERTPSSLSLTHAHLCPAAPALHTAHTYTQVDNLTYATTDVELREIFDKHGEIGDVYIPR
jgi:hypothetical protein